MGKPKLIDKATLNEELTNLYKDLLVDLGNPVIIDSDKGFVMLPTSTARANAWVCAYCHETPYIDPLMTKAEIELTIPEEEEVPLILFFTPDGKTEEDTRAIELHFHCAEELGLLRKILPDQNGRKESLTMVEVFKDLVLIENQYYHLGEVFTVCRSC